MSSRLRHHVVPRLLLVAADGDTDLDPHESAFLERYDGLRRFAIRVLQVDAARADDLVQDAFVQFTLARPDLEGIGNVDGYLMTLVRHLQLSWLRRRGNRAETFVAIDDFESASVAAAATPPDDRLAAEGSLARVAAYVVARKDRSRAASVLGLRYAHGLDREEIARLLGSPVRAVDRWLWQARREARAFLADPGAAVTAWPAPAADVSEETWTLRQALESAHRGPCPDPAVLTAAVTRHDPPMRTRWLSHIVSCRHCLAHVRALLGPPPPDGRGPAAGPRHSGRPGPRTGGSVDRLLRAGRRRRRQVLAHSPTALRVLVNGVTVGDVLVGAQTTRARWTLRTDEPLAFVEVYGSPDTRLIWMPVTPVPEGACQQRSQLTLADERTLWLCIDFVGPHPVLTLEYVDPCRSHAFEPLVADRGDVRPHGPAARRPPARHGRWMAACAAVAAIALWAGLRPRPVPTPADVLGVLVAREAKHRPPTGGAVHRTLALRVRPLDPPGADRAWTVEHWFRGDGPERAVRVTDSRGHLVAGLWTSAASETTAVALGVADDVWSADLTSAAVGRYVSDSFTCEADTASRLWQLTCEAPSRLSLWQRLVPSLAAQGFATTTVTRAALTVSRDDERVTRLELVTRTKSGRQVVTLEQLGFRVVPAEQLPTGVFAPPPRRATPAPVAPPARTRERASPSLHMRLLDVLDEAPGREYLGASVTPDGTLLVTGLVSDRAGRRALQAAIAALRAGDAVRLHVRTFEEAARASPPDRMSTPSRVELRDVALGDAAIVTALERRGLDRVAAQAAAVDLSRVALGAIHEAAEHAGAVHRARLDVGATVPLDPGGEAAWRALTARRVRACDRALARVQDALDPYFGVVGDALVDDGDLDDAVRRLATEVSAAEQGVVEILTAVDGEVRATSEGVADLMLHLARARAAARAALTAASR